MTQLSPSGLVLQARYQRTALGIAVTLAGLGVLLALLLPFRAHLSIATPALVFVLPALAGVVIGGFVPGLVGALSGFVLYDVFFLPPYNTLTVRSPQNWVALLVYVVVVLVVANLAATLLRFVLYRGWVFGASSGSSRGRRRGPSRRAR